MLSYLVEAIVRLLKFIQIIFLVLDHFAAAFILTTHIPTRSYYFAIPPMALNVYK